MSGSNAEEDVQDFHQWLNHFVEPMNNTVRPIIDAFNCYHPANYQTRPFMSDLHNPHRPKSAEKLIPNVQIANQTLHFFDWVAITEFFHES